MSTAPVHVVPQRTWRFTYRDSPLDVAQIRQGETIVLSGYTETNEGESAYVSYSAYVESIGIDRCRAKIVVKVDHFKRAVFTYDAECNAGSMQLTRDI